MRITKVVLTREHIFNINIIKLPLSVNTIANVNSEFCTLLEFYHLHRVLIILLFTLKSTKRAKWTFHLVRGLLLHVLL